MNGGAAAPPKPMLDPGLIASHPTDVHARATGYGSQRCTASVLRTTSDNATLFIC